VRPRRALLALLGLAAWGLVAPAPAAPGSAADGPYRVLLVHRVGRSLAPFEVTLDSRSDTEYGLWSFFELQRRDGRWWVPGKGVGGLMDFPAAATPRLYGAPGAGATPDCASEGACRYTMAMNGGIVYHLRPDATSRYYLVSTHVDVHLAVSSPGWRVTEVHDVRARRVLATGADATGVRTPFGAVEHFRAASAPGGRYGSSVFASVPCDEGGGWGDATLDGDGIQGDGGGPTDPIECGPNEVGASFSFAFNQQATTWWLHGDVVGAGDIQDRLFVVDFPRP
jgi:hypothetical protein